MLLLMLKLVVCTGCVVHVAADAKVTLMQIANAEVYSGE
jgi:hypothetical protein